MSARPSLKWLALLAGIWLAEIFVAPQISSYVLRVALYAGINVVLAVSLNIVNGMTGQFSLGHAGFMAVGGYLAAFLSLNYLGAGPLALVVGCLLGGLASSLVGIVVALPSFRLRGDYLAMVTLGFGEIIRVTLLNVEAVGGARGLSGIPFSVSLGWVGSAALLCLFVSYRVVAAPEGRAYLAVREDEIAAQAMGVNPFQSKLRAFILASFFAGIAGGLYAHTLTLLEPSDFDFFRSIEILIMVVLGGIGSIHGAAIAAIALTLSREGLRFLQEWTQVDLRMIVYSLLLVGLMLARRNRR